MAIDADKTGLSQNGGAGFGSFSRAHVGCGWASFFLSPGAMALNHGRGVHRAGERRRRPVTRIALSDQYLGIGLTKPIGWHNYTKS